MSAPGAPGGASRTISRSAPLDAEVRPPASKSLTQRALVCAALAPGRSSILNPLEAEDTLLMAAALRTLGARIGRGPGSWVVEGIETLFATSGATLRLGNAGTAMRFLTPVVALGRGSFTLDGSDRMRERPIGDLLEALQRLGVRARSYRGNGCPPVEIDAGGLPGGEVVIRGAVSSQFLSGLLLAAPRARAALTLRVEGSMVSRPYVGLTLDVMRCFGAMVESNPPWSGSGGSGDALWIREAGAIGGPSETRAGGHRAGHPLDAAEIRGTADDRLSRAQGGALEFRVPATGYRPASYAVEGDASSACWWLAAAAVTGGRVRVVGIPPGSSQGDLAFAGLLREMGCRTTWGSGKSPGGAEIAVHEAGPDAAGMRARPVGHGVRPSSGSEVSRSEGRPDRHEAPGPGEEIEPAADAPSVTAAPGGGSSGADPSSDERPGSEWWIQVEGFPLRGVEADLSDMPDAAPALGAVALFASSSTRIFGAAHLRAKESDRIAGLAAGLGSLGARVEEHRDGLTIHPGALRPATLDPLGDHRLAMAFAVAGLGIGDVTVLDPGCVAKSYPGFFDELDRITRTPS